MTPGTLAREAGSDEKLLPARATHGRPPPRPAPSRVRRLPATFRTRLPAPSAGSDPGLFDGLPVGHAVETDSPKPGAGTTEGTAGAPPAPEAAAAGTAASPTPDAATAAGAPAGEAGAPAAPPEAASPGADPKAQKAYAQLRPLGIIMAILAILLGAQMAYSVYLLSDGPTERYLEADGGDLVVRVAMPGGDNVTVSVLDHHGEALERGTTDANGTARFNDLDEAGVLVRVGEEERRVYVAAKDRHTMRFPGQPGDDPTAWENWPEPSRWQLVFSLGLLAVVLAGGIAFTLRRGYILALFGAGVLAGLALTHLLVGALLQAVVIAGVAVFAILAARRARPLFRPLRA